MVQALIVSMNRTIKGDQIDGDQYSPILSSANVLVLRSYLAMDLPSAMTLNALVTESG